MDCGIIPPKGPTTTTTTTSSSTPPPPFLPEKERDGSSPIDGGTISTPTYPSEAEFSSSTSPSIPPPLSLCYQWGRRYISFEALSTKWGVGAFECQSLCQQINECRAIQFEGEGGRCDILKGVGNGQSAPGGRNDMAAPRTCGWIRQISAVPLQRSMEDWISGKLSRMSLEEKIGQMIIAPSFGISSPAELSTYAIGAVLWPPGVYADLSQSDVAKKWDEYYDFSSWRKWSDGENIPPLISTDAVHGHGNAKDAILFPHNIGLGCSRDEELLKKIGEVTGQEAAATGVDWILAPTVAVLRDIRWGRTYESFSDDHITVDRLANQMVRGMQGDPQEPGGFLGDTKTIATCKHWVGDGGSKGGMTDGDTWDSEENIRDIHAFPYYRCIQDNAVQSIMPSFTSVNKIEMHGNKFLLSEVLKDVLGFDGILVGDYNGHARSGDDPNGDTLDGCSVDFCPFAIHAGIDMLMIGGDWKNFIRRSVEAVHKGTLSKERVDDAVRRILRVKTRLRLIGPIKSALKSKPSQRRVHKEIQLGSPDSLALARRAVVKSVVLLKNKDQTLPLKFGRGSKVLVTARHHRGEVFANFRPAHTGSWSLSWQNDDTNNEKFPSVKTVWDGIRMAAEEKGGEAVLDRSKGSMIDASYSAAIVVIGELPYAETKGDLGIGSLGLHARFPDDLAVLQALQQKSPTVPRVCVLLTGRPLYVNPHLNLCDAFLVAWLPGTEGGLGIADLISGKEDFTARLSTPWPRDPCQANVREQRGSRVSSPMWERGYGLSIWNRGDGDWTGGVSYPLPEEWDGSC